MKTCVQQRKTTTTVSIKGKGGTSLTGTNSPESTNKAGKRGRKTAGNTLPSLEEQPEQMKSSKKACKRSRLDDLPNEPLQSKADYNREFSGGPLHSPVQCLAPPVPTFLTSQTPQKFRLQLFPIDEVTRKCLEVDNHNPYLELTLGTRKKVSSVVNHLNIKWGNVKTASGELMLLPYDVRLGNLESQRRWTSKDSDTTVADVHTAIGNPAVFRLRYGWFSNFKEVISEIPAKSLHFEDKVHAGDNQNQNIADEGKHQCQIMIQEKGSAPADDSLNQGTDKSKLLDKLDKAASNDNQSTSNAAAILVDLSNFSFGALLGEASVNVYANPITGCEDSFDVAIANFKAKTQSTPVPQSSIWDAEETCNAFSFGKNTSSTKSVSAQSKDGPIASFTQIVGSSPLSLHDKLGLQPGIAKDDAREDPILDLRLHTMGEACSEPKDDSHLCRDVSEEQKSQPCMKTCHVDLNQSGELDCNTVLVMFS